MLDSKAQTRLVVGLILLVLTGPFVLPRVDWARLACSGSSYGEQWSGRSPIPPRHCGIGSPPTGVDRPAEIGKPRQTIRRIRLQA